jgi:hypothetical protein
LVLLISLLFLSFMALPKLFTGNLVTMEKTGSDFYSGDASSVLARYTDYPNKENLTFYSSCGQLPW